MNQNSNLIIIVVIAVVATLVGCHDKPKLGRSSTEWEIVAVEEPAETPMSDDKNVVMEDRNCNDDDTICVLQRRLNNKERELVTTTQSLAVLAEIAKDCRGDVNYLIEINKALLQDKRPVFTQGEKVIVRRGCKPTVSITHTEQDTTTYVVECAK